jgi:hypothetical protein
MCNDYANHIPWADFVHVFGGDWAAGGGADRGAEPRAARGHPAD